MPRALVLSIALAVLAVLGPASAEAYIAVEPLREVLRQASPDLRGCRERHGLPDGRYAVRLMIDPHGKVSDVALRDAPAELGPPAESCVEAAFTRLRFGSMPWLAQPAASPPRPGEPASHLPPARRRAGIVSILWPFVFEASPTD